MSRFRPRAGLFRFPGALFAAPLLLALLSPPAEAQSIDTPALPSKVIGSADCAECHSSEESVWTMSSHFRSNDLHRDPRTHNRAVDIATRMGLYPRDIPTHARCVGCHGTSQRDQAGTLRVIGGVSCESCHGAGLDYVDIHGEIDDYPNRQRRHGLSTANGMRYPHDAHQLGATCFQCHIITDEKLVNVGGHPARSPGFELVSWSQGEIRHNFYDAGMRRHKTINHTSSPQRRRLLYVTGLLLDLEHSLRALSKGEQRGNEYPYRRTMGTHSYDIIHRKLPALVDTFGSKNKVPAPLTEIQAILEVTDLTGPSANVLAAAIAVEQKAKAFLETNPSLPSAIDKLIPPEVVGAPYDPTAKPSTP